MRNEVDIGFTVLASTRRAVNPLATSSLGALKLILSGSWVVISGVISPLITTVTLLITLLITTHETPSSGYCLGCAPKIQELQGFGTHTRTSQAKLLVRGHYSRLR